MKTLCIFCKEMFDINNFDYHMSFHDEKDFDIKVPKDYNEYKLRMDDIGMLYEIVTEEKKPKSIPIGDTDELATVKSSDKQLLTE